MKTLHFLTHSATAALLGCLLLAPSTGRAVTILQSSGSTAIAWEAEKHGTFLNDPMGVTSPSPIETWTVVNDAAASEGKAIYALGANNTAFPVSYVDYRLQFTTPGSYKLYNRAKADVAWASADRFTANSFWVPRTFNAPIATNNPEAEAAYVRSASNGSDAQATPSSTNYVIYGESAPYEVTQAMVDNHEVVVLRIGTRERGMIIDRFVLSTDQALTEAGFNALPNTGLDNTAPQVVNVSPSISFTNVILTFDEGSIRGQSISFTS